MIASNYNYQNIFKLSQQNVNDFFEKSEQRGDQVLKKKNLKLCWFCMRNCAGFVAICEDCKHARRKK
jgi:hypothetical protein